MTNKPGNWRQGIAAFCRWGLVWLSIGLFTLLAGINLLRTAFMDINRESSRRELVSYEADHPLRFLLFLAAALAVTLLLQRWWSTVDARRSRAVHAAIFFAWGILGVWWIWNIGVEPSADQANILWAASRFAENDFTYLHHGQYLFRYPHQLPVTAFLELFLRLVGPDNPYRVQLLPALAIFGGFLFQLVWEGKSQYILQYFMLALPYGAAGLNEMAAALKIRILRLRSRQSKTAKAG